MHNLRYEDSCFCSKYLHIPPLSRCHAVIIICKHPAPKHLTGRSCRGVIDGAQMARAQMTGRTRHRIMCKTALLSKKCYSRFICYQFLAQGHTVSTLYILQEFIEGRCILCIHTLHTMSNFHIRIYVCTYSMVWLFLLLPLMLRSLVSFPSLFRKCLI